MDQQCRSTRYPYAMEKRDDNFLTNAINRNAAAVFSLPSAGMTRYHKTRFLRCEENRLWLESIATERPLIESLIQTGQAVTVTFKANQRTASFASPIVELDCAYRFFDTQEPVHAVLMHRPEDVQPLQRRTHYRVPVTADDEFSIKLWRIAESVPLNEEPPDRGFLPATVRDLSVGGIGVVFAAKPVLIPEQRLRILLKCGNEPIMLLEGRSGQVRKDKNCPTYETGVRFQGLQDSLAGRQMLTNLNRITQMLQLREARRARLLAK